MHRGLLALLVGAALADGKALYVFRLASDGQPPSPYLRSAEHGTVIASDGAGVRATVTIDFGSAGTVRLMLIGGVPLQKL